MDMAARQWLRLLHLALPVLITSLGPVEAQTANRFAGTFEERFSYMGRLTPIFARPGGPTLPTNVDVSPPASSEREGAAEVDPENGTRALIGTGPFPSW